MKPIIIRELEGHKLPQIDRLAKSGPSFIGLSAIDNDPVFYAGMVIPYPGFGEAWIEYVAPPENYILSFKAIRYLLDKVIAENSLVRVQAHARGNEPKAKRYMEHLGFVYEATLRKHGRDGKDEDIYAIIMEDN